MPSFTLLEIDFTFDTRHVRGFMGVWRLLIAGRSGADAQSIGFSAVTAPITHGDMP